ncbi:hypothetical protein AMAG_19030 [Allomyces macrogynus ATCC 38327]|uniref:Uncharacterized protein n=1 Tax=Allomyces macrogynus (strain ATCC 38327) TaxID=578462 RepID=A0A0L0SMQ9_ALLM3|nr:hypothetical protein AMAG_19030 [Allomyces macrogynus ATCC 38327]|eukprot:KNE63664.1 hypothetical protein AMAG_19030 [Allomyces macrogynus ATCC 38327]
MEHISHIHNVQSQTFIFTLSTCSPSSSRGCHSLATRLVSSPSVRLGSVLSCMKTLARCRPVHRQRSHCGDNLALHGTTMFVVLMSIGFTIQPEVKDVYFNAARDPWAKMRFMNPPTATTTATPPV